MIITRHTGSTPETVHLGAFSEHSTDPLLGYLCSSKRKTLTAPTTLNQFSED